MEKIIIGNWKCHPKTLGEAKALFDSLEKGLAAEGDKKVIVCPPFVFIPFLKQVSQNILLGAQNSSKEDQGAFTGEVSPPMLKSLGIEYVILGHSERRAGFHETDAMINQKIKAALASGLKVIFCIGENQAQRNAGKTEEVLKRQLSLGLKNISIDPSQIFIAYEPIWAIGTGKHCDFEKARQAYLFISGKTVENSVVLYGGSVNSDNARDYLKAGYGGVLVGGASLKPREFLKVISCWL